MFRLAKVRAWLRRERLPVIQLALAVAIQLLAPLSGAVSLWIPSGLLMLTAILTYYDNRQNRTQAEEQRESDLWRLQKAEHRGQRVEGKLERLNTAVDERQKELIADASRTRASARLLSRMVDEGLIDESRILEEIDERSGIIIYCYCWPVGYSKAQGAKAPNRTYPDFLKEKLGCIRLKPNRSPVFLTTTHRLPRELGDVATLRDYIEQSFQHLFSEEWAELRQRVQAGEANAIWKVDVEDPDWRSSIKGTILVSRIPLGLNNIVKINGGADLPGLYGLVSEIVDLRRVSLNRATKKAVREFVFAQEFDILLEEYDPHVIGKLNEARGKLDRDLGCKTLFDYLSVPKRNLESALAQVIEPSVVSIIAGELKDRLRGYEDSLHHLGIHHLRTLKP